MDFTHTVAVPLAPGAIDLAAWIFAMSDEDYKACAKGHRAMGIIGGAQRLGIINVEEIAGTLIVQHYYTKIAAQDHVRFVSEASEGFLLHTVPFTMQVHWEMQLTADGAGASRLRCAIGFNAPNWVTAAGAIVRNNHFVEQHLIEETGGFARDLVAKFGG